MSPSTHAEYYRSINIGQTQQQCLRSLYIVHGPEAKSVASTTVLNPKEQPISNQISATKSIISAFSTIEILYKNNCACTYILVCVCVCACVCVCVCVCTCMHAHVYTSAMIHSLYSHSSTIVLYSFQSACPT